MMGFANRDIISLTAFTGDDYLHNEQLMTEQHTKIRKYLRAAGL
jgi:hypothetical protein